MSESGCFWVGQGCSNQKEKRRKVQIKETRFCTVTFSVKEQHVRTSQTPNRLCSIQFRLKTMRSQGESYHF